MLYPRSSKIFKCRYTIFVRYLQGVHIIHQTQKFSCYGSSKRAFFCYVDYYVPYTLSEPADNNRQEIMR